MVRTNGAAAKMHFRLAGGPVPFSVVASDASRHEILPAFVSPPCLRLDMVHGQRDVGPATVLASVPVAPEHVLPGKDNSLEGYSHEDRKPNDAGQRHRNGHGAQELPVIGSHELGFSEVQETDRLLDVADAQGLVIVVENEHLAAQLAAPTVVVWSAEVFCTSP